MTAVKSVDAKTAAGQTFGAQVYCPICTHTVPGQVWFVRSASGRKMPKVVAGQKCLRCASPLDAGYVMRIDRAA